VTPAHPDTLSVPPGVFREATTDFTVDARALTQKGGNHIKTLISNPSGSHTDALITDLGDGTYSVEYTPYEEGERLLPLLELHSSTPDLTFSTAPDLTLSTPLI